MNLERYISFDIQDLRLIDTYQFLSASLKKLVKNLSRDAYRHVTKHLGTSDLLFAEGIFPYQWFNSFENVDLTDLPWQEAFYSEMNQDGLTVEEYSRAREVWSAFNCHTFKDYHDFYMQTNVILLADVFENFEMSPWPITVLIPLITLQLRH